MGLITDLAGGGLTEQIEKAIGKKKKKNADAKAQAAKDSAAANSSDGSADPDSYKRGGLVRKTGMALVHRGERVLTKKQARARRKSRSK